MLFKLLKTTLTFLFLLLLLSSFSREREREKEIKISIKPNENNTIKKVKFYGFYGHDQFLIDSTELVYPITNFTLKSTTLYSGFYRISFTQDLFYDFISFPGDSLTIVFNPSDFKNGLIISNEDNKTLLQFKKELHEINNTISLIQSIQSSDTFIQNTSMRSIIELKLRKNSLITSYQNNFRTPVFKILSDFLREPIDDNGIESGKLFLQNLHLYDSSAIRTNFISQKLIDYLAFYKKPDADSFNEGIKEIFDACGSNEFTRQYCLYFYLQLFYKVGPEQVFKHLIEEYYFTESCHEMPEVMNTDLFSGINKLITLLPGNKIEKLTLINQNGEKVDNYTLSKNYKQVLYFFWHPECGYCDDLIGKLKINHRYFKKNKIRIVSFAITKDKKSWFEKSKNFSWVNTSDLLGWNSEIIKELAINKTPMLILTDSNNIILKYDFYFEELIK